MKSTLKFWSRINWDSHWVLTQVTRLVPSSMNASSDGLFPVKSSSRTTPKLYTSPFAVALPVSKYSAKRQNSTHISTWTEEGDGFSIYFEVHNPVPGAKYPKVPATNVETWVLSGSIKVASPKSETLASIFWSSNMLLDLISLWIMWGMQSWWRYTSPLAAPTAILYLEGQSRCFISFSLPAASSSFRLNINLTVGEINIP